MARVAGHRRATAVSQPTTPAPGIRSINAVTLRTGDMAASVAFYRALGMTVTFGGADARFTSLGAGDCHVNLTLALVVPATPFPGRIVFYVDDVDTFHERICAAGYVPESEPADAPWGERFFHIHDPSGHELSFARPLSKP